eukprot:TRINITY_DN6922_c0_g1_i2.p1 TRINITY_DN6922_c0_g1~~TRINITY_DN6922_c0_g1_i2.p1  ORF type:complete len:609 (+),score=94.39 TRINITY_DN6922_c0_g1_i2:220-2046(+)
MENIQACVRIKPVPVVENEDCIICGKYEENSVQFYTQTSDRYNFELVFDEKTSTDHIFSTIGAPSVSACLSGINVCIFAYGQTSSGKTHTMKGDSRAPGLIPLTIKEIFQKIAELSEKGIDVEAKVSYIEIYNETVNDLLNPKEKSLEIRDHLTKGTYIPGLTESIVRNDRDAYEFFNKGEAERIVAGTSLNEQSSRSHTVFRISLEIRNRAKMEKIMYSTLNLVDLAGSEGVSRAKTEGVRKREGANINKSLLALSTVISKLSLKESFVNYRDSKLTRLLQPCLGGNSRTIVICTISPLASNFQETLNTVKFGMSAGAVKNHVKVNERSMEKTPSKDFQEISNIKHELSKQKSYYEQVCMDQGTRLEDLEKALLEAREEIKILQNESTIAREELKRAQEKIEFEVQANKYLQNENKQLVEILGEYEANSKKTYEDKIKAVSEAYTMMDGKITEVTAENLRMKDEIITLIGQLNLKDEKIKELNQKLSKYLYFDGHANNNYYQGSTSSKENGTAMVVEPKLLKRKEILSCDRLIPSMDELASYETASKLSAKLFEKNNTILDLNNKLSDAHKELRKREDQVLDLETKLGETRYQLASLQDTNTGLIHS